MKLSKFKQNVSSAQEGVWVDVGDGLEVKIARMGNKKYNETIRKLSKPYKTAIRNGTLADSVFEEMQNKAIAEAILLDWTGLEDDKGEITYSTEEAFNILSNPEFEDFKKLVTDLAEEQETFRSIEIDETVGE